MGRIQTYTLYTAKETISTIKRQPTDWKKQLQTIWLTKVCLPKYTNSSDDSTTNKQTKTTQLKNVCVCAQLCPTLCNPTDYSPPGSSVHGILQARILEWVAISVSRESFWPRDQTQVSCTSRFFYHCTTWEATNGQKTQIDISPKKTYRWPTGTWEDVQYCYLLKKCKPKLQWGITSGLSDGHHSKNLIGFFYPDWLELLAVQGTRVFSYTTIQKHIGVSALTSVLKMNIQDWFPLGWTGWISWCYGFSSSYVWMWELDYKESWAQRNWCFWTILIILKEISPGCSLERLMKL